MGGKFKPYQINSTELSSLPILAGQFIFCSDTGEIYIDINDKQREKVDKGNVNDILIKDNLINVQKNDGTEKTLKLPEEVFIGTQEPVESYKIWIDTSEENNEIYATKEYVNVLIGNIETLLSEV